MAEEISLSIEETNRLRAQIGLPLLPVKKEENDDHGVKGKLELSVKETNKLRASLGLRPLVEEKPEENPISTKSEEPSEPKTFQVDTRQKVFYNDAGSDWLENVGKGKKAAKAAEAKNESSDRGIAVGHKALALADVQNGDVFTLEDQNVLNDDEERMVNEKIAKAEKLRDEESEKRKMAALKFGARFEEDEEEGSDELAQMSGSTILLSGQEKKAPVKTGTTKMDALFDDLDEPKPTTTKFKKKSKKKSLAKKREIPNDEELETHQPMVTETLNFEEERDEEDEIQQMLAKNREKLQKKRKLLTPEQLAQEIQLHQRVTMGEKVGGVVFDDTSEFLSSIGRGESKDEEPRGSDATEINNGIEEGGKPQRVENDSAEEAGDDKNEHVPTQPEDASNTPKFGSMADTLKYLRGNNMVKAELSLEKEARKQQEQRVKEAELQRIAISIEERSVKQELELDQSYSRLSKEEQDSTLDRILNERLIAKGIVEVPKGRYSNYKSDRLSAYNPQVQLRYKDNQGNELDQKQAFKQLSHDYHGTAPKHKKKRAGVKSEGEHVVG